MKRIILFYMVFLLIWFGGSAAAFHFWGESAVSTLGIGVAGGVFVAEFRQMVNAVFNISNNKNNNNNNKPPAPPAGSP
jgi:hypothetical protein